MRQLWKMIDFRDFQENVRVEPEKVCLATCLIFLPERVRCLIWFSLWSCNENKSLTSYIQHGPSEVEIFQEGLLSRNYSLVVG